MPRINRFRTAPLLLTIGLAAACSGEDASDEAADFSTVRDAAEDMRDAIDEMANADRVDPVDFRVLRDAMDDELAGMTRVSAEGQRSGAMGMTVSTASARYESEDGATVKMTITDLGGVGGPAMAGMAVWAAAEIDRETDDGYERTTTFDGDPAYEKFTRIDGDLGRAELSVLIDRRFLLQLEGNRIEMDVLHEMAEEVDVDGLEGR